MPLSGRASSPAGDDHDGHMPPIQNRVDVIHLIKHLSLHSDLGRYFCNPRTVDSVSPSLLLALRGLWHIPP
jgi:hypothetical protein